MKKQKKKEKEEAALCSFLVIHTRSDTYRKFKQAHPQLAQSILTGLAEAFKQGYHQGKKHKQ